MYSEADRSAASSFSKQKFDFDDFGPVIGGGVEWGVTDNVRMRFEGLYYAFNMFNDKKSITISAADSGDNIEFGDVWSIRVGLSWYF